MQKDTGYFCLAQLYALKLVAYHWYPTQYVTVLLYPASVSG